MFSQVESSKVSIVKWSVLAKSGLVNKLLIISSSSVSCLTRKKQLTGFETNCLGLGNASALSSEKSASFLETLSNVTKGAKIGTLKALEPYLSSSLFFGSSRLTT